MKKIVLLVALCLCVGNLFAQDADKLRDEGDAALKAKDYATVVTKYGEYLKQNNYQDTARIFNCGYAANQAKNYAEAAKYFDMAVKMNYNVDDSYVGEAMAYRNLNKAEEFLTTVKEGLKVIPDGNKNRPIWKSCFTVTASNKDKPPKRREIWPVPRKCTKRS